MIKQLLKVWLVVLTGIGAMIGGWIIANRMQYIEHFSTHDGKEVLLIIDQIWVDVPDGRWLHLQEEGLKAERALVYVDSLNPVFRTYTNPVSYTTYWRYYSEHGEPLTLTVIEIDENYPVSFSYNMEELTVIEQMDGVEVGYNEPLNDENFVLHLKSDEKTIQLRFHFSQLERLMPVLKKAWTIMNGEKL